MARIQTTDQKKAHLKQFQKELKWLSRAIPYLLRKVFIVSVLLLPVVENPENQLFIWPSLAKKYISKGLIFGNRNGKRKGKGFSMQNLLIPCLLCLLYTSPSPRD